MSDDRDRNETEVRSALISALGASELDYGKVLELAHLLSKEDKDNIRFSVDAGHVSRLGLELVSKQETAIAELIKMPTMPMPPMLRLPSLLLILPAVSWRWLIQALECPVSSSCKGS
ncbi:hypothetical protein QZH47_26640 [Pseudomonas corrugata]